MADSRHIETLVMRMQEEFVATPALRLTRLQAERRFAVDGVTCEAVLGALVDAKVLTRTPGGGYARFYPRAFAA